MNQREAGRGRGSRSRGAESGRGETPSVAGPDRPTGEATFVGRAVERAIIRDAAASAAAGRATTVWIEGAAGSGKTALVRQALADLPPGFQVRRAEADELGADVALAVAEQLGPLTASSGFAAGLEILAILSVAQDAGPVAVVVEDLHWADATSRQALLTAARRLHEDQVVLIVTSRPTTHADDGWQRLRLDADRCHTMTLGPLAADDVAELAQRTGVTLTGGYAARLHEHTKGLPLYVHTLLRELTPEELTSEGPLPAPSSLASTILAALSGLSHEAQALAFALAVLNRRVPLRTAGRVAGVDQPAAALEALLAAGLVSWWPVEPETPIEFGHPLYRTAVYEDLSPTRRRDLHQVPAELVQASEALSHRVAAADGLDDRLAGELVEAATENVARGEKGLAARHFIWASGLTSQRDQGEIRLLEAARLLLAAGQTNRAAAMRARVEACQSSALRSLVLGLLAWETGEETVAERALREASSFTAEDAADAAVAAAALAHLGVVYSTQIRAGDALGAATACLAYNPTDPEVEQLGWTALAYGEAMLQGANTALTRLTARFPKPAQMATPVEAQLLLTRGALNFYAGRTAAAITDLRAVLSLIHRGAAVLQVSRAHLHLAQLLRRTGDWDEALLQARVALSLVSDERQVWMDAQVHGELGRLLAYRGEWDTAATHISAARDAADHFGMFEAVFTARIGEAELARARGHPAQVIAALTTLAESPQLARSRFASLGWWPSLIEATLDVGDIDRAEEWLSLVEGAADERGLDLRARLIALAARVDAARGRPDRAATRFAAALDTFGPDDPVFERALVHHDFGRLLRARGNRSEAVHHLRSAHELMTKMGATPFLRRVEADLRACGLRAATSPDRSAFALTEREQDVVALVAKGLTNREISAELYVSQKAVEYHLRNVFGKLGISSRRDLRAKAVIQATM